MQEYLELYHMEPADEIAASSAKAVQYYMLHHHVLKPSSNITRGIQCVIQSRFASVAQQCFEGRLYNTS